MISAVHELLLHSPAALAGAGLLPLAWGFWNIIWGLLATLLVLICLLLMAIILIQDPKGGGLASAFGASSGAESIIGARAQKEVNVWTSALAAVFIVLVFAMVMISNRFTTSGSLGGKGASTPTPPPGAAGPEDAGKDAGPNFDLFPPDQPGFPGQPGPGPEGGTGTPGGTGTAPPAPPTPPGDGGAAPKE